MVVDSKLRIVCDQTVSDAVFDSEGVALAFDNGANVIIYNKFNIYGPLLIESKTFIGLKAISVEEVETFIKIIFENEMILKIDMTDEGFNGPEAIQLRSPSGGIVVWN